jgi:hypothetical protein
MHACEEEIMATDKQQNRQQPQQPQQPQTESMSERTQPDREERTQPGGSKDDDYGNYREKADKSK